MAIVHCEIRKTNYPVRVELKTPPAGQTTRKRGGSRRASRERVPATVRAQIGGAHLRVTDQKKGMMSASVASWSCASRPVTTSAPMMPMAANMPARPLLSSISLQNSS
mmetsp:Transcript_83405/g.217829  ORF Transcript_83405/g.217829 Transcript_83405/m.217829 type:complete len:108 (-) Transcript_83405:14-337(-)